MKKAILLIFPFGTIPYAFVARSPYFEAEVQNVIAISDRESQSFNGAVGRGVDRTVTIICVVSGVLAAILFILIR